MPPTEQSPGTVLIVEQIAPLLDLMGEDLESEGFEVLVCPGPSGIACLGLDAGHCPLAATADVVVLSGALEGDVLMEGSCSQDLQSLYRSQRLRVVQVNSVRNLSPSLTPGPEIQILNAPQTSELMVAVRAAVAGLAGRREDARLAVRPRQRGAA